MACAAPWLSPAPWLGAQAGPCLPTPQIWLQFVLAPTSTSPKWETQPLFLVLRRQENRAAISPWMLPGLPAWE